jgi:hypothetical protein
MAIVNMDLTVNAGMVCSIIVSGVKGTAGAEGCMRCRIEGKTFADWVEFYSGGTDRVGTVAGEQLKRLKIREIGGKKKESNTHYYATLEVFPSRKVEDLSDYTEHVTHCTPCNLDTRRNYVSQNEIWCL